MIRKLLEKHSQRLTEVRDEKTVCQSGKQSLPDVISPCTDATTAGEKLYFFDKIARSHLPSSSPDASQRCISALTKESLKDWVREAKSAAEKLERVILLEQIIRQGRLDEHRRWTLPGQFDIKDYKIITSLPKGLRADSLTISNCRQLQSVMFINVTHKLEIEHCYDLTKMVEVCAAALWVKDCNALSWVDAQGFSKQILMVYGGNKPHLDAPLPSTSVICFQQKSKEFYLSPYQRCDIPSTLDGSMNHFLTRPKPLSQGIFSHRCHMLTKASLMEWLVRAETPQDKEDRADLCKKILKEAQVDSMGNLVLFGTWLVKNYEHLTLLPPGLYLRSEEEDGRTTSGNLKIYNCPRLERLAHVGADDMVCVENCANLFGIVAVQTACCSLLRCNMLVVEVAQITKQLVVSFNLFKPDIINNHESIVISFLKTEKIGECSENGLSLIRFSENIL